jgi:hypothetical protein
MNRIARKTLYWTPRLLCIAFALFLSLFALDVFDENEGWDIVLALLMHLVPVYLVIGVLALAWRWEWTGAVLFTGLGLFYIIWTWGKFHWSAPVCISGPLFLVGGLFLLGWMKREEIRS